jgi:hypothetical protein
VFAVSDIGHSEPAEACLQVDNPNGPPPIVDGPIPTPGPGPVPVIAGPNCPTFINLAGVPVDPSLVLTLEAAWDEQNRGVALAWTMPEHARCAWFQFKRPNSTYSGFETIPWADFILAPGNSSRVLPSGGGGGTYCYRLWAFSAAGRSQPAEACVELDAGSFPTPPPPGGAFPTPGLPPAPLNVRLAGRFELADAHGRPLPWEQQTWFAGISWEAIPGFEGTYQVERARTDPAFAHGFGAVPTGRVPATNASWGRLESVEQLTPGTSWCFRVRAVVQGHLGPPSNEVCTPDVPTGQAPPPTVAPLPPDAGNARATGAAPPALLAVPLFMMVAGALVLARAAAPTRR